MIGLGIQLVIWSGKTIPTPSPLIADLFEELTISSFENKRSGFELSIRAGRSGPQALLGYLPITLGSVETGNRIVFTTAVNGIPRVLFDGIMTQVELLPSEKPGEGRIKVKGDDLTFYMNRKEKQKPFQGRKESDAVREVLSPYLTYGVIPDVRISLDEKRGATRRNFPFQKMESDLEFLNRLAKHLGQVFFLEPGPIPGQSRAYFGPPRTFGFGQPSMRANQGAATNVTKISILEDPGMVKKERALVLDEKTGRVLPARPFTVRPNTLAVAPILLFKRNMLRDQIKAPDNATEYSDAKSPGAQNLSADQAIKLSGTLDTSRYGGVLRARDTVAIGGVGTRYDGDYRVMEVTHRIKEGSYTQDFKLARDGLFTNRPNI